MIHDTFLNQIPDLVKGNSISIPVCMAFSSDNITPAEVDSSISGEAGSRVSFYSSTVADNSITFTSIRTSNVPPSGGTFLNVSAVYDATTNGSMWASALLSSLLHQSTFDLQVDHKIEFIRT